MDHLRDLPVPEGLTPNIPAATYALDPRAQAHRRRRPSGCDGLRGAWLNPPSGGAWGGARGSVPAGIPDRLLPVDESGGRELKQRTLTNLYNQHPAWLVNLHRELDEAVAAAYGWPADLPDEEVLKRLLELNRQRAAAAR